MRILLWHGYLLEGTGSNIYTRAVAREWGRAGHEVVVFCQDPAPERFDLAGAEVVRPELDTRLPTFVIDRYEGLEPVLLQDMPGDERERYVSGECCGRPTEHLPADLVFANHVLMGGPVAAATGGRFAVKAHGSELEYSMRGNAELEALGATSLARRRRRLRRLRPHPRGARGRGRTGRAGPRGAPWRRRRPVRRSSRGEDALAGLLAECRADPPNPGNRQERLPDEGNAATARRVPRRRRADRPLLRQAPLQQGRPRAPRGAAGHGRPRGRRRLRRLPPRTRADGAPTDAVHGPARAPPPRPPDPARRRRRRAVDLPGGVRHGRGRGRGRGLSRRSSRGTRGSRRSPDGIEDAYPAGLRHLASFQTGDSVDLARKLHGLLALPAATRAELGEAARRVAVEHWSWAGVARRLLEPFE